MHVRHGPLQIASSYEEDHAWFGMLTRLSSKAARNVTTASDAPLAAAAERRLLGGRVSWGEGLSFTSDGSDM